LGDSSGVEGALGWVVWRCDGGGTGFPSAAEDSRGCWEGISVLQGNAHNVIGNEFKFRMFNKPT
jgi:hypothetical protein